MPRLRPRGLLVLAVLALFIQMLGRQSSMARAADASDAAHEPAGSPAQQGGSAEPPIRVAPYVDVGLTPHIDLTDAVDESGLRHVTLAFIVDGGGCRASWAGYGPLGSPLAEQIRSEVAALRQRGVDVVISFGGAINHELAVTCGDEGLLASQYQAVIDAYHPAGLDFDIEGAAQSDVAANDRRSRVLQKVQERNPGLRVSYTIPVAISGLTGRGLAIVDNALARGVRLSTLNLMTMYFGDEGRSRSMGENATQALSNAQRQLSDRRSASPGVFG